MIARTRGMLVSHDAAAAAVQQLAEVARDVVDSAVGAGASLMSEDGSRLSAGTTDRIARTADALQYELGQGPCISAWATGSIQRVDDTGSDPRWPEWCGAAHDLGIRSVLSAPLILRNLCIGALKVYSTSPAAFGPADERRMVLLTAAAATLLGMATAPDAPQELSEALVRALADRQAVDTTTGMLMERHHLDRNAARYRLLDESRITGRPTVELANRMVERRPGADAQDHRE